MYHVKDMKEVRTHNVHFIDIDHTGNMVMVSLSPDRLRLRFHTALGAENRYTSVEHSQRTLNFGCKVHMARRVDDVDAGILPETGCCGGGDRYATLLLLLHPVHRSGAFVCFAEFVVDPGVKQNTLRGGCFPGIDVSLDSDVSCFFKRIFSRHLTLNSCWDYHLKCAKALLASAFLCMSSRFFTAEPVLLHASMISPTRRSFMVFSPRLRE
jgi:hypothetical protein